MEKVIDIKYLLIIEMILSSCKVYRGIQIIYSVLKNPQMKILLLVVQWIKQSFFGFGMKSKRTSRKVFSWKDIWIKFGV
jgi:hypothetical protein